MVTTALTADGGGQRWPAVHRRLLAVLVAALSVAAALPATGSTAPWLFLTRPNRTVTTLVAEITS